MKKKKISKKKLIKLITKIILQHRDILKGERGEPGPAGPVGPSGPMGKPSPVSPDSGIKMEDIYCDIFKSCPHTNLKDQLIHMSTKLRFDLK